MALKINNGTAQATGTSEFWNNFPVKTAYAHESGRQGSEVGLLDQRKYVINIDDNMRNNALRSLPMMKIFEKVSNGASISKLMHTWIDKYDNEKGMKFMPFSALRTRDYYGSNSASSAWGTGASSDISSALGSLNEMGGKLQFQSASCDLDSGTRNLSSTNDLGGTLTASSTIFISDSVKYTYKTTDNGISQGIMGELKETASVPVAFSDGTKESFVLAYGRGANDTQGRPEDFIWLLSKVLGNRDYTLNNAEGIAVDWMDDASLSNGVGTDASASGIKTFSYTYTEGSSKMTHLIWDIIYTKVGAKLEGFTNRMMGLRRFIWTSDLNKFILIFDMAETNFPYLEKPNTGITGIIAGQHYIVTAGTVVDNSKTYYAGAIFKAEGAQTLTGVNKVSDIPTGFLVEEVNTAQYSNTTGVVSGIEHAHSPYNRFFMPAIGMSPEGFSRIGRRLVLNYNYDMQSAADASGAFDLSKVEGGYPSNTEGRGKNFMQIFRSVPWGRTRLQETTDVQGGNTYDADRMEHLEKFYTGINATLLLGKLDFGQNLNGNTPISTFAYNSGAGLDGEYAGKTSGLLDYSTFQLTWARIPFYMGRPGYDPKQSADLGYAVIEFCEKVLKGISWKKEFGKRTVYTAIVSRQVVNTLGLTYAKNASAVTQVGNPFGTEIRYNAPGTVDLNFETFSYVGVDGDTINFVIDDSLDFAPKFKAPRFLLGKEKVDPRWLILLLNKNDIVTYSHKGFPDQVFQGLQPNHAVNVQYEGAQASRLLEVKNPEDQMVIDISPLMSM